MNIQNDFVSKSTDEEDKEEKNEVDLSNNNKKLKINLTEDKKLRFEQLKARRGQLKEKYDRKRSSKVKIQNPILLKSCQPKADVIQPEEVIEHSINQLEKQLDSAIASNQVDLAEKLSDCLANKQSELKVNKAYLKHQFQLEIKKKQEEKKKKKLAWTFEAKKRWETKSNM
jgi:hypothetical protein